MPVTAVCPNCTAVVQFVYPLDSCPRCEAVLPQSVQEAVATGLVRDRARRPVLLTVGMVGSLSFGALLLLILPMALLDAGNYTIADEELSGLEFLRRVGLLWTAHGAFLLGIGYGLLREKSWARPFMMLYWLLVAVGMLAMGGKNAGEVACSIVVLAIPAGIAAWYLYGKDNVVAYYNALLRLEEAPATTT